MPLDKSGSKESIGANITLLKKEKYPPKQRLAIVLDTARRAGARIKKPSLAQAVAQKGKSK